MAIKVVSGKRSAAFWIHLYGVEGIGKSSFGAEAPDPIFVDVEHGTNEIATTRYAFEGERTRPNSYQEVLSALVELRDQSHPYRTIVLDTVDALEGMIWEYLCAKHRADTLTDIGGGFGKGHDAALTEWRKVVAVLEAIVSKGLNVITLGHAIVKNFKNPEGLDFDRYIPKLHEKAGALIKERAGAVLFANYRVATKKDGQRVRGVTDKARLVYTDRTAAWDAKNRYSLPEMMALRFADVAAAIQAHKPADPAKLRAAILEKIATFPDDKRGEATRYLESAGNDAERLSKLNAWVNAQEIDPAAGESGKTEATPATGGQLPAAEPAPPAPAAPAEDRSLQPGVDVPAMDAKPAPAPPVPAPAAPEPSKEKTPKALAYDSIIAAMEAAKTAADLTKEALPLIKQAIERNTFDAAEISQIRTMYTDLDVSLRKKAGAK